MTYTICPMCEAGRHSTPDNRDRGHDILDQIHEADGEALDALVEYEDWVFSR